MKTLPEIVNEISSTLTQKGYELIKEDRDSLYQLLKSDQFQKDLKKSEIILSDLSTQAYFFILLHRLEKEINENQKIITLLNEIYKKTENKRLSEKNLKPFFTESYKRYISNICKYFLDSKFTRKLPGQRDTEEYKYIYKMIDKIKKSDKSEKYYISCHIGHFSLYKSAICRKNVEHRKEHKNRIMTLKDYKKYGQTYYSKASDHDLAKEDKTILKTISEKYDIVRTLIDGLFSNFTDF